MYNNAVSNSIKKRLLRQFLAILLAFVLVGSGVWSYFYITKTSVGIQTPKQEELVSQLSIDQQNAIEQLKATVQTATPEKLLYTEFTLDELKIYPKEWVANKFTEKQQANALISDAEADADNDDLTNRREFLYGANPNNPHTFCGVKPTNEDGTTCKTDKQFLDEGRSPLTGLLLEIPKKFRFKIVDKQMLEGLQESFGTASKEGVDFPAMYELARTIDLRDELKDIQVVSQKNTGNAMIKYYEQRLDILKDMSKDDELSSFTSVYGLLDSTKLEALTTNYNTMITKLQAMVVPELMLNYHKANIMILQKLSLISDHRSKIISEKSFLKPENTDKSQKLGKEMLWAYRNVNEEQAKVQAIIDQDNPKN